MERIGKRAASNWSLWSLSCTKKSKHVIEMHELYIRERMMINLVEGGTAQNNLLSFYDSIDVENLNTAGDNLLQKMSVLQH